MRRGGNNSNGFTIVETMIVLAVSAILAVSAMVLISGRQSKTQFMVASNDLKQQVEQIINETRNGYYPGNGSGAGDFGCNGSAGTQPVITNAVATNKYQGTNGGCIFLGNAVEFGLSQSGADPQALATYPLVGNQQFDPGTGVKQEVTSFDQAMPKALAPGATTNTSVPDHSRFSKTENGLTFKKVTYNLSGVGVGPHSYSQAVFVFADDLSGYGVNGNGGLNSTTENLNLYYVSSTPNWLAAPQNSGGVVDGIDRMVGGVYHGVYDGAPVLNSVDLCFDGGTGQTAIINITGLGQLSVKLRISTPSDPLCA